MHRPEDLLRQPTDRAARVVARRLLARAKKQRARLGDPSDAEALHDFRVAVRRLRSWLRAFEPWLGDNVPRKAPRRLRKATRSTNVSRDTEVHLAWLRVQRRTLGARQRPGLDWLVARITTERATESDIAKGERAFDRAQRALDRGLRERRAAQDGDADAIASTPFGVALAEVVRGHAAELRRLLGKLQAVQGMKQAHDARIATKRLRYLLQQVVGTTPPEVEETLSDLSALQDSLGEYHDASLLRTRLEEETEHAAADGDGASALRPGLLALARRLRARNDAAFVRVRSGWLAGRGERLLHRVDEIADRLAEESSHAVEAPETTMELVR